MKSRETGLQGFSFIYLSLLLVTPLVGNLAPLANATPRTTTDITVKIGWIDFDLVDTSLYHTLTLSSSGSGAITYQSDVAKSGKALNLTSDSAGTAYLRWGLIKKTPTEELPIWASYGFHFKFDIYVYSSTLPSAFTAKWGFYPSKTSPQLYLTGTTAHLKNSTGSTVSTTAFSYGTWHWIDIAFFPRNNTINVYWDNYDTVRLAIPETNLETVYSFQFGDSWANGGSGKAIFDNLQLLGDAKVANTHKPIYYVEIIAMKKESFNDPIKLIDQANKTGNMRFTFLLENSTRYLSNKTVTDKVKSFITQHPGSIAGLWIPGSPTASSVQSVLSTFHNVFGHYPKTIGAYTVSQTVINTAKASPYNVKAFMSCVADANGYSQFWNYPFFVSDKAKQVPSLVASSGVIGFQWATTHPLWYLTDEPNFLAQGDFSYGGYSSSQYKQFQYFVYEANNTQFNDFGFILNGIETDVDWQNTTVGRHVYNWTILEWDRLMSTYPTIIQGKSLFDVANTMLTKYSETPLYLLYYPNWRTTAIKRDTWIIEGSAYRSMVFNNSSYFGVVDLCVFGNTSKYWLNNGYPFNFKSGYPEIIRSHDYPFHGITVRDFVPTSLSVVVGRGAIDYVDITASDGNNEWQIQYFAKESNLISLNFKALRSQTIALEMLITARRNETFGGNDIINDWKANFRIDDAVYSWANLTASTGRTIISGFNLSSVWIQTYTPRNAVISKMETTTTRAVNVTYSLNMTQDQEAIFTFVPGFDARIPHTLSPPSLVLIGPNVNITSWKPENNKLNLSVSVLTGETSTSRIYCGNLGNPYFVSANHSYDSTTKICTITVTQGTEEVEVTWDDKPPVISNMEQDPHGNQIQPYQAVTIRASIADTQTGVDRATISYRTSPDETTWSSWVDIPMNQLHQNTWNGTIPGFEPQTHVQYKVTAYDKAANNATTPIGQYHYYLVVPEFPTLASLLPILIIVFTVPILLKRMRTCMRV